MRVWVIGLLFAGSAFGGVTVSAESDDVVLQVGDGQLRATVTRAAISGPDVKLLRRAGRLSGTVLGSPVRLAWDTDRLRGNIGRSSVRVELLREAAGSITLEGVLAGTPVDLRVSPTAISGRVGGCDYSLEAAADAYEGWSDCGAGPLPVPTTLRLPDALADSPEEEQVALLTLLLANHGALPVERRPPGEVLRNTRLGIPIP